MYKISFALLALLLFPFIPFNESAISENASEWSTMAEMPTPRTEITASTIGSSIYVIGGINADGSTSDAIEVYDPRSNTWSNAEQLPIPLHHAASATHQGKLYVIGGYTEGWVPSNRLLIYDPLENEWIRGRDMPTPRGALTSQFIDGILYALGGSSGRPLAVNEAYDPETGTWVTRAPMPTAREHLASGVVDGKMYVIGGRQGSLSTNLNVNEMYDPEIDEWVTRAPMPTSRGGIVGASLEGSIFVFGGEMALRTFNDNEQYIAWLDLWIKRERMPSSRHGLAAVEAGGNIYVIGGGPSPGLSVSDKNEVFTPSDWRQAIEVDVRPSIRVQPENPQVGDQIKVTISFSTNSTGYTVKFDNLTQTARTFTSEITILPPLANSERIPENFSHTYTLEGLEDGDYFFSVSVNEDKHIIRTKFTVTGKTYFVDISKEELVKVKIQDMIILQRTITNPQDADQNFIHVLQVKDERGLTVSLKWISGELSAKESRHISQTWMPEAVKTYSLQFFVWESMESPRILDEMYQITVEVS